MNYLAELNALYHFMLRKKMPKSEFALLLVLYMVNNAEDWELWFEADNELLQRLTGGYSREAINKARNGLKQKGRIDFRPGKRNEESARYMIIPFIDENGAKVDMKIDMKVDKELDKEVDVKLDPKTKHKQNKNNIPPNPPEGDAEKKARAKRKTSVEQYNQFMKNEYDFDALEKELLEDGENTGSV